MNDMMIGHLKKWAKHPETLPMRPEVRDFIAFMEARGEARGELKGKQEALLAMLAARKLAMTASQRARIMACEKVETLDRWIKLAATAASVSAVLVGTQKRAGRK